MIKHEEAMTDLRKIAESITSKQWQKLTPNIERIRGYINEQEKKDELLDLYRLQQEFKEPYNTSVRLLDQQECLDHIREIAEEIYLKEKENEEME